MIAVSSFAPSILCLKSDMLVQRAPYQNQPNARPLNGHSAWHIHFAPFTLPIYNEPLMPVLMPSVHHLHNNSLTDYIHPPPHLEQRWLKDQTSWSSSFPKLAVLQADPTRESTASAQRDLTAMVVLQTSITNAAVFTICTSWVAGVSYLFTFSHP